MYNYQATVVRWIDGDSVWLNVDLGFRMHSEAPFRLNRIDTPERGERGWGAATSRANQLAPPGTVVYIRTLKNPDKYGRWLVEITNDITANVNDRLIAEGHAVPWTK